MKKQANCLRCLKYQEIGAKRHSQITGSLPNAPAVQPIWAISELATQEAEVGDFEPMRLKRHSIKAPTARRNRTTKRKIMALPNLKEMPAAAEGALPTSGRWLKLSSRFRLYGGSGLAILVLFGLGVDTRVNHRENLIEEIPWGAADVLVRRFDRL